MADPALTHWRIRHKPNMNHHQRQMLILALSTSFGMDYLLIIMGA